MVVIIFSLFYCFIVLFFVVILFMVLVDVVFFSNMKGLILNKVNVFIYLKLGVVED